MNWFRRSGMMDESYIKKAKKKPITLPPRIEQLIPPKPRKYRVRVLPDLPSSSPNQPLALGSDSARDDEIIVSPVARPGEAPTYYGLPSMVQDFPSISALSTSAGQQQLQQQQQQNPSPSGATGEETENDISPFISPTTALPPAAFPSTVFSVQQDPVSLRYFSPDDTHDPDIEAVVAALNGSNLGVMPNRSPQSAALASTGAASPMESPGLYAVSAPVEMSGLHQQPWRPATAGDTICLLDRSDDERNRIRAAQRESYKRQLKLTDPPVIVRFPEIEKDEEHEAACRQMRREQRRMLREQQQQQQQQQRHSLSPLHSREDEDEVPSDDCTTTTTDNTHGSSQRRGHSGSDRIRPQGVSTGGMQSTEASAHSKHTSKTHKKKASKPASPSTSPYTSPTGRSVKPLPPSYKMRATRGLPGKKHSSVPAENKTQCLPRLCTMGFTLLDFVEGVIELRVLQYQRQITDPPLGVVVDPYVFPDDAYHGAPHSWDARKSNGTSSEGPEDTDDEPEEDALVGNSRQEIWYYYHPRPFTYEELVQSPKLLPERRRREMRAALLGRRTRTPDVYGKPVPYTTGSFTVQSDASVALTRSASRSSGADTALANDKKPPTMNQTGKATVTNNVSKARDNGPIASQLKAHTKGNASATTQSAPSLPLSPPRARYPSPQSDPLVTPEKQLRPAPPAPLPVGATATPTAGTSAGLAFSVTPRSAAATTTHGSAPSSPLLSGAATGPKTSPLVGASPTRAKGCGPMLNTCTGTTSGSPKRTAHCGDSSATPVRER